MSDQFIGVDVGGTKIAAAVLEGGELSESAHRARPSRRSQEALRRAARGGDRAGARTPETRAVGHRHAVDHRVRDRPDPAPASTSRSTTCRCASCSPSASGCRSTSRTTPAARRWPRRSRTAGSPCSHLVMFTIGTGVGGGWVLNGRLYRGATTSAAEVGHTIIGRDLDRGRPRARRPVPAARARSRRWPPGRALDRLADDGRDAVPGLVPRQARGARRARSTGHDVVDGAEAGDDAVAVLPARPRRAARHRHRQRDQHVRPARGRDRRRRLARRRPAARAGARTPRSGTSCPGWA